MRAGIETLAQRHRDLVVDPAMRRVPAPRVGVIGGYVNAVGAVRMFEILLPPGIGFVDRHAAALIRSPSAPAPRSNVAHRTMQPWDGSRRRAPALRNFPPCI